MSKSVIEWCELSKKQIITYYTEKANVSTASLN